MSGKSVLRPPLQKPAVSGRGEGRQTRRGAPNGLTRTACGPRSGRAATFQNRFLVGGLARVATGYSLGKTITDPRPHHSHGPLLDTSGHGENGRSSARRRRRAGKSATSVNREILSIQRRWLMSIAEQEHSGFAGTSPTDLSWVYGAPTRSPAFGRDDNRPTFMGQWRQNPGSSSIVPRQRSRLTKHPLAKSPTLMNICQRDLCRRSARRPGCRRKYHRPICGRAGMLDGRPASNFIGPAAQGPVGRGHAHTFVSSKKKRQVGPWTILGSSRARSARRGGARVAGDRPLPFCNIMISGLVTGFGQKNPLLLKCMTLTSNTGTRAGRHTCEGRRRTPAANSSRWWRLETRPANLEGPGHGSPCADLTWSGNCLRYEFPRSLIGGAKWRDTRLFSPPGKKTLLQRR